MNFASEEDVYDGATVFFFGYPEDAAALLRKDGLVRAITRSGIIAWTDPTGVLENPLLIDANVLPGNSGGPAFRIPTGLNKQGSFEANGRAVFLGIVTATVSRYYQVQADGRILQLQFPDLPRPSIEQVQVIGIGGLGAVEPASKVKTLVQLVMAKVQAFEEQEKLRHRQ